MVQVFIMLLVSLSVISLYSSVLIFLSEFVVMLILFIYRSKQLFSKF